MPGPLSFPSASCVTEARLLDTDEKRTNTPGFKTGKSAKKHQSHGAPITEDKAPKNLKRRLKAWSGSKQCQDNQGAFHRPGSMKK